MNTCGLCKGEGHNIFTSPLKEKKKANQKKIICEDTKFKSNYSSKSLGTYLLFFRFLILYNYVYLLLIKTNLFDLIFSSFKSNMMVI